MQTVELVPVWVDCGAMLGVRSTSPTQGSRMTQKPRRDVNVRATPPIEGRRNLLFALLEKVVDSIASAGPVGWISLVAIGGFLALVLVVHIMAAPAVR